MSTGRFVVFSGGEGSGKTTVRDRLKIEFPGLVVTREPGGTPAGQRIRDILVEDVTLDLNVENELFLFLADRAEHVAKIIRPALAQSKTVISDRYWMDTFAYQWWATMGRLDLGNFLAKFQEFRWPDPDLWVWFDVDPAAGLQRRNKTGRMNRLDQRQLAFHTLVRQGFSYLHSAGESHHGLRFRKLWIDANQDEEKVYAAVRQAVRPLLST